MCLVEPAGAVVADDYQAAVLYGLEGGRATASGQVGEGESRAGSQVGDGDLPAGVVPNECPHEAGGDDGDLGVVEEVPGK